MHAKLGIDVAAATLSASSDQHAAVGDRAAPGPLADWIVRPGLQGEIPDVAERLTAAMTLGRRQLALAQLAGTLRRGGPADVFLSVAHRAAAVSEGETRPIVAAAMATRSAADAALLLGVGHLGRPEPDGSTALLCATGDELHRQLAGRGIRFVQAACEPEDEAPCWTSLGYRRIAQLEYLFGVVAHLMPHTETPPGHGDGPIVVEPLDPLASGEHRSRWIRLVDETFQETLDCPLLNAYRSAADVVASYIDAPAFDASGWHVLRCAGRAAGCLIMTPHQNGAVMELTYMGVVPAHRGRGLGTRLFATAIQLAAQRGAVELMLAVDQENRPAAGLYRRAGMTHVASEAVWGRSLTARDGE